MGTLLLMLSAETSTWIAAEPLTAQMTFLKRKKKHQEPVEKPRSPYQKITGRDSVELNGVMNVFQHDKHYYLEFPASLQGRDFLVTNRLQRVQSELNEAGANKGINYEGQTISFEWSRRDSSVLIRQQRLTPEVPTDDAIAQSVRDNYINPLIAKLKVEAVAPDSSTVLIKIDDLFNGKETSINDVFNKINLGTSAKSDLSRILSIKAFERNIVATSELTTLVREGMDKVNITVEVSSSLTLLPEQPMTGRRDSPRIGYFTTDRLEYADRQLELKTNKYITRWRLVPSDKVAYMRGELVEPETPITFYLDPATPTYLQPYIRKGIEDWNTAFERAGFRNAVRVLEYTDSIAAEGDDMKYSVFTYAASPKANAMGPSVIDPRTGEILEADIIWWHNVVSLLREWIIVQTGAANPDARTMKLPESIVGDAARMVACHEVGHSLGLRHNMIASNAFATDSLRSASFTERMHCTAASIMDYARFNYVAQPGDGVKKFTPNLGVYDLFAIEYGYRWYPDAESEEKGLATLLKKHTGPLYRYSEAQPARFAIDPRALTEDLGDDAVKSATYGIANLKRIVPNIVDWTRSGKEVQTYEDASKLYAGVIYQWNLYLYHVLANVGGIYMDNTTVDDGQKTYTYVEKDKQKAAVQFLLDEALTYPAWLFNPPLADYTFIVRERSGIQIEQNPNVMLKNALNFLIWDMLDNERLVRMFENEFKNGSDAFTAVEMMDMLHKHIFAQTLAGRNTDVMSRNIQKSFIDLLITAAAESEGVKINKALTGPHFLLDNPHIGCGCSESRMMAERAGAMRTIEITSKQISRTSDALSVKRGELTRVLDLLKSRRNSGDTATRYHYNDLILRIQTALGLNK